MSLRTKIFFFFYFMPAVDLVLLCWGGLTLLFVKATVQKDMLNVVTIGLGFIVQAVMMALIFFK